MAWCAWCGGDCIYSTEMCRIGEIKDEFIDGLDDEFDEQSGDSVE